MGRSPTYQGVLTSSCTQGHPYKIGKLHLFRINIKADFDVGLIGDGYIPLSATDDERLTGAGYLSGLREIDFDHEIVAFNGHGHITHRHSSLWLFDSPDGSHDSSCTFACILKQMTYLWNDELIF